LNSQRVYRASRKTAEERVQEKNVRDRLQKEKPTLDDLVRNGECNAESIMTIGMYFDI
jgi:hypothetical protein